MFTRLGRLVVGHPWRVIAAWVIAAIAIIGFAPKLATTSNEASFLPSHYQSVQAQDLQQQAFPAAAAPAAVVVFERADGQPLTATDSARVGSVAASLAARHIPAITRHGWPTTSRPSRVNIPVLLFRTTSHLLTCRTVSLLTCRMVSYFLAARQAAE